MDTAKLTISKIEAARRQLDCAIQLWFMDGDEVSIHTLACAAYQLVHDLKDDRGLDDKALLYDSAVIKDEYRKLWIKAIKKPMNFFKHADNDADETLEFRPDQSFAFIMGAASGLRFLGERPTDTVCALSFWLAINKPNWITPKFLKLYEERVGIENLQEFKLIPKSDFLESYLRAGDTVRQLAGAGIRPG